MRVLALAFALLAAGCVTPDGETPGAAAAPAAQARWDAVLAQTQDLPCEGAGSPSSNLRVLSHDPMGDPAIHRELDHDPHRPLLASARYVEGAVDLIDVADPLAPRVLATWAATEDDLALDVKFTSDGQSLVVAGDEHVWLVDVRDPAAPAQESVLKLATATAHMVTPFVVDGVEYVAASKGEGGDLTLLRMNGAPGGRTLTRVAQPALTPLSILPGRPDLVRSHDTWFEVDPETGAPILWVANVWFGALALDVRDPAHPRTLATLPHADAAVGYSHTVRVAHLDGKRLVVVGTEYGYGALKVWDATDLAAPRLVATWSLGGDAPHNFQVVGTRAYVTYFEHGFYVLDLANATKGQLPILAHVPATGTFKGPHPPTNLLNAYYGPVDVVVKDGVLWVGEETEGLTALAYGCLRPGDAAATSIG